MKTNKGPNEKTRCACCGAKTSQGYTTNSVFCSPECSRMHRTGESMDDLVREASLMPEFIPKNNRDYEEFDLEKMMTRKDEDE